MSYFKTLEKEKKTAKIVTTSKDESVINFDKIETLYFTKLEEKSKEIKREIE